jgi:hypothetical protein
MPVTISAKNKMKFTRLFIEKPSTARLTFTDAPRVFRIYSEKNNRLHFTRPNRQGLNEIFVNFPRPGAYTIEGTAATEILPLKKKIYPVELPPSERTNSAAPNEIFLTENFDVAHTPARINAATGEVQVCAGFTELPNEVRFFILLHELGHRHYKTETLCDQFALKKFLECGYNPSQAVIALTRILRNTPQNLERVNNIFKLVTQ